MLCEAKRGDEPMTLAKIEGAPWVARWTGRIALFSLVLLVFGLVGHRFFGLTTPVLLSLLKVAFAGAIASIVLGIIASVLIWRQGGAGAARIVTAFVIGGGMLTWPLAYYPVMQRLPEINDVTTDTATPPEFIALAAVRAAPANGVAYRREPLAARQVAAYPDLVTLTVNRSCEETFDLVVDAVKRQKMEVVRETPPDDANGRRGSIEAVDRTLIVGFSDDISVRVVGDDRSARVDFRSASRYGRHDFGRNAQRLRDLMREVVVRLESTIPGAVENRRVKRRGGEVRPSVRRDENRRKEVPHR